MYNENNRMLVFILMPLSVRRMQCGTCCVSLFHSECSSLKSAVLELLYASHKLPVPAV